MSKKKIFIIGIHALFCILFVHWFYNNSFIRPYSLLYKEVISALLLLFLIYLNYLFLIPYFIKRSYYTSYIFLSLLLLGIFSITEFLIVNPDIISRVPKHQSFDINTYLRNILFVIFLRNAGFYLFFTVFKLYLQTKATALIEKKEALSHDGLILLLPLRGKPISININYVSYFSHERNLTFIHDTEGKASSIYSTLSNIQEYLGDSCLRVNKENIITFTNIISYNEREVIVKDGKDNKQSSLTYSKKDAQNILNTLREKVPSLEEKRIDKKKQNEGVNVQKDDGKCEFEGIKKLILEEINNFPGINTITLTQKFGKKSSLSTIERKLKELKESGLIEFRGAPKTGGYYPV